MKLTALVLFTFFLVGCDKDAQVPVVETQKHEVTVDAPTTVNGRKVGTTFDFTTRKMGEPA